MGGGDPSIIYKTDFSNYDYVNNIDYPEIGSPTAFTSDAMSSFSISQTTVPYGLTNAVNALNIGMSSSNDNAELHFNPDVAENDKVDYEFCMLITNGTSSMPTFMWTDTDIGLCNNSRSSYIQALVPTNYSQTNYNNVEQSSNAGYYWKYNDKLSYKPYAGKFNFVCDFVNGTISFLIQGILIFEASVTFQTNKLDFKFSPRRTQNNLKVTSFIARKVE